MPLENATRGSPVPENAAKPAETANSTALAGIAASAYRI
jgi:hypothetical protein